MLGTPILVLAVALFILSLLIERILEYRAARRRQSASRRLAGAAPARPAGRGGLAAGHAAGFSADADDGLAAPAGEPDLDHTT